MLAAIRARRTERLATQLDDWSEAQVADALEVIARLDAALSP